MLQQRVVATMLSPSMRRLKDGHRGHLSNVLLVPGNTNYITKPTTMVGLQLAHGRQKAVKLSLQ